MAIRQEVTDLASFGPLPASDAADEATLERFSTALSAIAPPLNVDEATLLASSFGPDDCFGLAWTLVHLIETAPQVSFSTLPFRTRRNQWVQLLEQRKARSPG